MCSTVDFAQETTLLIPLASRRWQGSDEDGKPDAAQSMTDRR